MRSILSSPADFLLCRPEWDDVMMEELECDQGLTSRKWRPGLIQVTGGSLPRSPLLFEWQRLPRARFYPLEPGGRLPSEVINAVWSEWERESMPWAVHAFPLGGESNARLAARLGGIRRELAREGGRRIKGLAKWERRPERLFAAGKGVVLQWGLTPEGLLFSAAPPGELTSAAPGGQMRMKMDPAAPSRSYLKIEEAFHRMGIEPGEDETVIDLGAAPGGWSYACAKRGSRVIAVDNGPLKIQDACVRRIEHVHADGLTFRPDKHLPTVDWLVGDMLIPPGDALGVLRAWLRDGRVRNLVFNIKLPQRHPLAALTPVRDLISSRPGLTMRHLYHDRREVTVFGSLTS